MALCAANVAKANEESYYYNSIRLLDELARAKAELDIAGWHLLEVSQTTAAILMAVQVYFEEEVIPCTEWPTPPELAGFVLNSECEQGLIS